MVALFLLMCMTTVDTITRKTTIGGIPDSLDLTELFLVLIIFCGFAFLESEKGHIRVDMFVNMFPKLIGRIVRSLLYLVSAAILFLCTYALIINIIPTKNSGASTQLLHIPTWPFIIIATIAYLLYAITVLANAIEIIISDEDEKSVALEVEEK
jgi:TRAP-type C4-dicarboxylate transport system permease small subunit